MSVEFYTHIYRHIYGLYSSWNSLGLNTRVLFIVGSLYTRVSSLSLLQVDLPNPGIESRSPTLQAYSFPREPQGKPIYIYMAILYYNYL